MHSRNDENLSSNGLDPNNPTVLVTSASAHVMPSDEAERYSLLWDAAAEMTRSNEQSRERNWLRLMDAFWRGDLAPSGLTYFYSAPDGQEFFVYDRTQLAGMLLGHHALDIGKKSIDHMQHWRVADYLTQPDPFGNLFQPDPEGRVGLAVLTQEFDRWRKGSGEPVSPNVFPPEGRAPPNGMRPTVNPTLRAAIENALKMQGIPGKTVSWKPFCDHVRTECQVTMAHRGYGDKTIKRIVKTIEAGQDKTDK